MRAAACMAGHQLAMDPGDAIGQLPGIPTTEPAFGLPAVWIPEPAAPRPRRSAAPSSTRESVIVTHLTETIRTHAAELLTRQETRQLLDQLKELNAAVVDEVVPDVLSLGEIQRVLQALLREGVSIRDLGSIVEAIGDKARLTRDPALLAEYARQALGPHDHRRRTSTPRARCARSRSIPRSSRRWPRRSRRPPTASSWRWSPTRAQALVTRLAEQVETAHRPRAAGRCCCARRACAATCAGSASSACRSCAVCSYNEIVPGIGVETIGVVEHERHRSRRHRAPTTEPGVKTFRGESLEELLPQIREELGADAVVLRQREGLKGGVGGFFQKRCVEVDARAGAARVDTYAGAAEDEDIRSALDGDTPDFAEELEAELEAAEDEDRFTRPAGVAATAPPPGIGLRPAGRRADAGAGLPARHRAARRRALRQARRPGGRRGPRRRRRSARSSRPPRRSPSSCTWPTRRCRRRPPRPRPPPRPPRPRSRSLSPPVAPAQPVAAAEPAAAGRPGPGRVRRRRGTVAPAAPARPVQADTQELALVEGGLSPALAADVVAETVSHLLPFGTPRQLKRLVRQSLARRIPVQGPRALGGAALVLAGAGGTGKTLTVARLAAAYAAGSDLDVVVIALRPRDGGAELAGLLAPAGIAVEVAESATEAKARIAEMAGRALVLVDTPAVSPGDEEGVKAFAADLRRLKGAEVHLCVPATLSAAAAKRVVAAFAPLKAAGIVLTHVDETPQVGAVVELAINGGPALTFIGRDTGLDGGLELADPASVAALVLP